MASTIQIKSGTGSAIPTSLSQAELAINVDSGALYYGTKGGTKVSSSFYFSQITASGDISSSGIITAEHFESSDDITAAGTIQAEQLTSTDDASVAGDLVLGDAIIHSGDIDTKIAFNTDSMRFTAGNVTNVDFRTEGPLFTAPVTSSVDISGSSTSTFRSATGSYDILQGDTTQPTALSIDGHITASGNVSASKIITDEITHGLNTTGLTISSNITSSGDISGSGRFTYGTPGVSVTHEVYGRFRVIGSDITLGEGHITASGDISASGNVTCDLGTGSFGHVITDSGSIEFRNPANKAIVGKLSFGTNGLDVDDNTGGKTKMRVGRLDAETIISGQNITASNNISASGTIQTPKLSGGETGDQSGSLYLSGSITFRDNEAIPAVSASTLYNNNGHLYYGAGLIGGYHLSASADDVGYIKIIPTDWIGSDATSTGLYYNGPVLDDSGPYGVSTNNALIDLYVFKDIPAGWTATAFKTFGNGDTDTVTFHVYDLTDGTRTADGNTGTISGDEVTLASPVVGTSTNYVGLLINPDNTSDIIFGGYIKIERR